MRQKHFQEEGNIAFLFLDALNVCKEFHVDKELEGNIIHEYSLTESDGDGEEESSSVNESCDTLYSLPLGNGILSNVYHESYLKDIYAIETSDESEIPVADISDIAFDIAELDFGTAIKSNVSHQQLEEDIDVPTVKIKDILQSMQELCGTKPKELNDSTGTIMKGKAAKAISDCAGDLAKILKFMVYRKRLYYWSGCVWVPTDEEELMLIARENLHDDPLIPNLSSSSFEEIYKKLLSDPQLQVSDDEVKKYPYLIPGKDGVIDTLIGKSKPSEPRHFIFAYSNFSIYEVGHGQGRYFELFIANCTGGDRRLRKRILEMIGVVLSGYMPKSFFLLLGPKNTGKSQLLNFLRALVGESNTESVRSLNEFSGEWTTGKLLGKKICVCPDVPKEIIKTPAMAIMRQLCGGDLVSANRKYHDPFTFVNTSKLIFAANDPLQIENAQDEEAFIDRCVIVPFKNSVPRDKMIPDLAEHLYAERGYIISESIKAFVELRDRNFVFTSVDTPSAIKNAMNPTDSVVIFSEKQCYFCDESEEATSVLYEAYAEFCRASNFSPLSVEVFSRTLAKTYPDLIRIRNAKGVKDRRGFKGISI